MEIGKLFKNIEEQYKSHKFKEIKIDSRDCKNGDIFLAINGITINGNIFIKEAIRNKAKTIISNKKYQGFKKDVLFIHNKNPRKLLAELSSKIYSQKPKNLVAVTGTNGKSSITNFFHQILSLNNKPVSSIGTLGININKKEFQTKNTTLDSLLLNKYLQYIKKNKIDNVILEASSHGLKQNRLDYIKFDIGIFTNLSRDHLDYHRSFKDYLNSKLILFKRLMKKKSKVIFNDNIKESNLLKKICKKNNIKTVTFGKMNSDLNIINHFYESDKQIVNFFYKKNFYKFETKLIGKIQVYNLLMAMLAAHQSKVSIKKILNILKKIKPVNGRMEQIGIVKNNAKIILDYAHTPDALQICLINIKEQFKNRKINIVFGCGGERDKPKRKLMGHIANKYCDKIYLTDDNPRSENPSQIRSQIKNKIFKRKLIEIPSREKAISSSIENLKSGEILLVAGKGHEIYQDYKKRKFFSDKKCILRHLKNKNKNLSADWKLNIINEQIPHKNRIKKINKINSASINSKKIEKNDIFIGIKGKKFDGSRFANEAIKNGALFAIVRKNSQKKNNKKIYFNDTFKFFRETSRLIRQNSKIKSIAITGSSGKTSVKELLGQTLNKLTSVTYSKKSFNNQYGVPLSLFKIKKENKFGVFELGMSKKGEIHKLTEIVLPDTSIITNISEAHLKNFKNIKGIALAKSEIMDNMSPGNTVILNKDDKFFNFFKKKAISKHLKIISFGIINNANIKFIKFAKFKKRNFIVVKINGILKKFMINEEIKLHIQNLLITIAVLSNYYDISIIKDNIFYNSKLINGRGDIFKFKYKSKNISIVDESYNSNPLSLKYAINNFDKLNIDYKKKYILLGDMLELGGSSQMLHNKAVKELNRSKTQKIYVFGKYMSKAFNKIKTQKRGKILKSKKDITDLIKNKLKNNDYLMVKASNGTGIFNMISKLKSKGINAL